MAFSYVTYTGNGTTTNFAVPFSYISQDNITLKVDGVNTSFTWVNPNLISVAVAPTVGAQIEVRRSTEIDQPLVDFQDASTLTESDLDLFSIQMLYIAQEAYDALVGSIALNGDGFYTANNRRIVSVADPVDDTDAVNKRWVLTESATALAQTLAAKAASLAAQAASETARDQSVTAKDASITAKTGAETALASATTQAGNASTSATAAAASALASDNSKITAGNSEAAAAIYANNALTSQNAAELALDTFTDIYLGAKASNPTTDNDGNTLQVGALYFNSVTFDMRGWNGTAWQQMVVPAGSSVASFNGRTGAVTPQANDYVVSDINGLVSALAAKADQSAMATALGLKADSSALATKADAVATTTALAGKAATVHTHAIADVTGLQAALDVRLIATVITGLDKTGATDVGAALNAAIAAAPTFGVIFLPQGLYHTTVPIVVDNGKTLIGMTGGFHSGALDQGTCIRGALSLTPVVKLDGGAGALSSSIKGVNITRATGTIPASCIGLELYRLNNALIEDCVISRHALGLQFTDLNVTVRVHRVTTATITSNHWVLAAQAIEIYFDNCRCGINGSVDVACQSYMTVVGGAWDTIRVRGSQWNLGIAGGNSVNYGVFFQNYNAANPNGIIMFSDMHIEGINTFFFVHTGQTARIIRLGITNCQINISCPLFGTAAMWNEVNIASSRVFVTEFTVDQQFNVIVAGCTFNGNMTVNAANASCFTGNRIYGNCLLQGANPKATFVGNSVQGTLTQTALSGMVVANNA